MSRHTLRQLARKAHANDVPWQTWWPIVAKRVKELEPWNLRRYHRLVSQLMMLVLCGNLDGQFSPADDDRIDPWVLDDAAENSPPAMIQQHLFDESQAHE